MTTPVCYIRSIVLACLKDQASFDTTIYRSSIMGENYVPVYGQSTIDRLEAEIQRLKAVDK